MAISSNILDILRPKPDEYSVPVEDKPEDNCIGCLAISGAFMAFFGVTLSLDRTLAAHKKADKIVTTRMIPDYFGPYMRLTMRGVGVLALIGAGVRAYEIYETVEARRRPRHH